MSKFFNVINKHYFVSIFGVIGIEQLIFAGRWKGESLDEAHIIGVVLLVGSVILYYMPDKKN